MMDHSETVILFQMPALSNSRSHWRVLLGVKMIWWEVGLLLGLILIMWEIISWQDGIWGLMM